MSTSNTPLTKSALSQAVEKYFRPSSSLSVQPKHVDPVVKMYTTNPDQFPFAADHGKGFKYVTTEDASDHKTQKKAILSMLQLHAHHITLSDEFNGVRKVKDLTSKRDIQFNLHDLRTYFGGDIFKREYFRKLRKIYEPEFAEAAKKLAKDKQQQNQKQQKGAKEQPPQQQQPQKRKTAAVDTSSSSSDSDSDSDSDSSSSDSDDNTASMMMLNKNRKTNPNAPLPSASTSTRKNDNKNDRDDDSDDEDAFTSALNRGSSSSSAAIDSRTGKRLRTEGDDDGTSTTARTTTGGKKNRYIVFVGNLDYRTKEDDLKKLFSTCDVIGIRMSTNKLTKQPNGYCFVEFSNARDVHHALGYHKTSLLGRPINVELTAGGGGNSAQRRTKIMAKRDKLDDERQVRLERDRQRAAAAGYGDDGD